VRIPRVYDDAGDLARLREAEGVPRLAGIGALEDAVAMRGITAQCVFAGADVDDVRIGRVDGDRADRAAEVFVGDRLPGVAAVGGLHDAAAGGARVVLERTRDGSG